MDIHSYYRIEELIESSKRELIQKVEWVKSIKQVVNLSADTINTIKNDINHIQNEIKNEEKSKELFLNCIEKFRQLPETTDLEYQVIKSRYIDYMTIESIVESLHLATMTVWRYLRKGETTLIPIFNHVGELK